MKTFFAVLTLLGFLSTLNAQSTYLVTVYGDTVACDSVDDGDCIIDGKLSTKFEKREITLTVSNGETTIFKKGFNKGKIIMASDSVLLTLQSLEVVKHGLVVTDSRIYFIDRASLDILHEYSSWYLDGAGILLKYFPKDDTKCPRYSYAIEKFDVACKKAIETPTIEGRMVVRAWNDCFPMKKLE
ncbi:MAG: hypothetical protein CL840_11815 [Crocinitomicaceae bacterium]|nr:hypothetical protein [Crocinitomicaceae bacterium]|tara:strand:+ start:2649 stop:3203 length:555 start_codon:yes stop_codon:yes gene_type:complete